MGGCDVLYIYSDSNVPVAIFNILTFFRQLEKIEPFFFSLSKWRNVQYWLEVGGEILPVSLSVGAAKRGNNT